MLYPVELGVRVSRYGKIIYDDKGNVLVLILLDSLQQCQDRTVRVLRDRAFYQRIHRNKHFALQRVDHPAWQVEAVTLIAC